VKESFDALLTQLMATGFFLEQAVEVLEKGMIERALQAAAVNQSEAAKMLGIHRNTLQRKMAQYKIDGKRPRRKPATRAHASRSKAARAKKSRRAS
jgi:DNA-binding NtrC family response regulator